MPILLAKTVDGEWRPGIGDPTFMGWLTVVAYLAAMVLCARVVLSPKTPRPDRFFWWSFTAALLLLGINKQLDIQTYFTVLGRRLAKEQGWYSVRRTYQAAFVAGVAAAGVVLLAALTWRMSRRRVVALIGMVFLVSFVVIRAASFTHVDGFLGRGLGPMRWNWILELGGIVVIGWGAQRALGRP